jgi:hypothetical protein
LDDVVVLQTPIASLELRYRDFKISVVRTHRLWKWTASLEAKLLTGHASSQPKAITSAKQAVDKAAAPKQLVIEERVARILLDAHQLPPGPDRDSIVEEALQIIGGIPEAARDMARSERDKER